MSEPPLTKTTDRYKNSSTKTLIKKPTYMKTNLREKQDRRKLKFPKNLTSNIIKNKTVG